MAASPATVGTPSAGRFARPWALDLAIRLALGGGTVDVALRSEARTIGIVGPSGAGKTTLLRVLAGVERRAAGTLLVAGEVWQAPGRFVPPWERGVGWVPQDGVLFPHLSVAANLGYAAKLPVAPIAALLEVSHLLDRQPRHLSGGERQRVALGRALAADPRLLLLDEPFSALDATLRERLALAVAAHARGVATGRALPLVLVSHHAADLATLVEEAWEIRGGGLVRL